MFLDYKLMFRLMMDGAAACLQEEILVENPALTGTFKEVSPKSHKY